MFDLGEGNDPPIIVWQGRPEKVELTMHPQNRVADHLRLCTIFRAVHQFDQVADGRVFLLDTFAALLPVQTSESSPWRHSTSVESI